MPRTEPESSDALLNELAQWVRIETPTTDGAAVNRLMDVAHASLGEAGATLARLPGRDGFGDILIARTPGEGRPILLLGHLDTVWSHGTLATMPFRVEGDRAYGPGIYDMKAGSLLGVHVVRSLLRRNGPASRPITLLLTPDEEVGSPTSRAVIEQEARNCAYALVLEPASANGTCVTARKGVGRFRLEVTGQASHAGTHFRQGASAVVELARQILAVHEMVDEAAGITLNVAPIQGGTRPNVVAGHAEAEIDLRVPDPANGERMTAALLGLRAHDPRCGVRVTGGMNRPPYAESPDGLALYERARAVADGLGFALPRQMRGGGSDANFTAALGVPTLDGIGCPGAGAHASDEHILWRELAPRAALLAGLIAALH